jgi:hypothetical protein
MDSTRSQMQAFFAQARQWAERIERTTFSTVLFIPNPVTAEFTLVARWVAQSGEKGQYAKTFTKELVFGPSLRKGRPEPQKRVCVHMREFMKEVLNSRGV